MGDRVRTRGTITNLYGSAYSKLCNNATSHTTTMSGPSATGTGDLVGNGETQETRDVTTPGYQKYSREGRIFSNPFYSIKRTAKWSLGSSCTSTIKTGKPCPVNNIRESGWQGKLVSYMNAGRFASPPAWDLDTAKTLAGTAAMAGIEEPSVQGLVDLAEMRKTLRMLTGDIRALYRFFTISDKAFRRKYGRVPSPRESAEFLAQNWLKYRYGYTPLIGSIQGAVKALRAERKSERKTSRGKSSAATSSQTDTRTSNVPSGSDGFNYTSVLVRQVSRDVNCGVLYEAHTSLATDFGFNLSELPSAAYELVPYSFVADWFVNLGDWIRAVTPRSGIRILSSWTTVRTDTLYTGTNTVTPVNTSGASYDHSGGGVTLSGTTRILEKTRTPGVTVGLASKLQEINFEKSKDFKHAADAVALLVGRFLSAKS